MLSNDGVIKWDAGVGTVEGSVAVGATQESSTSSSRQTRRDLVGTFSRSILSRRGATVRHREWISQPPQSGSHSGRRQSTWPSCCRGWPSNSGRWRCRRPFARTHVGLTCTCMTHIHFPMRTTIELSDQHRAKLLELAAERGEKGFSRIVKEAVERYLLEQGSRRDRVQAALKLRGSLGKGAADALEESVALSRSKWR